MTFGRLPRIRIVDRYPSLFTMAAGDRFAKHDFPVAIGEGGERRWSAPIIACNILVEFAKQLFEGIGESFVMAARVACQTTSFWAKQGRVSQ